MSDLVLELASGLNFTLQRVDSAINSSEIVPEEWIRFMPFLVSDWEGIDSEDVYPKSSSHPTPHPTPLPCSANNCAELFSQREFDQVLFNLVSTSFSQNTVPFDWEKTYSYACDIYTSQLNEVSTEGAFSKIRQRVAQYNGTEEAKQPTEHHQPNNGNPYCILGNEHILFFNILRDSRAVQAGFGVVYNSIHISEFIDYYQKVVLNGDSFTARLDSVWGINRYLLLMRRLDSIYVNFQHEEAEKRRKKDK